MSSNTLFSTHARPTSSVARRLARLAMVFLVGAEGMWLAAQVHCPKVDKDSGEYVLNVEGNWYLVGQEDSPLERTCHLPLNGKIRAEQHRTKLSKIILADNTGRISPPKVCNPSDECKPDIDLPGNPFPLKNLFGAILQSVFSQSSPRLISAITPQTPQGEGLADAILLTNGGFVNLAPVLLHEARGHYKLVLERASDDQFLVVRDIDVDWDPSKPLPNSDLSSPGAYRVSIDKQHAWVVVANQNRATLINNLAATVKSRFNARDARNIDTTGVSTQRMFFEAFLLYAAQASDDDLKKLARQ